MHVCSLADFPAAPAVGTISLEEADGEILSAAETQNVIEDFHKGTFPELPEIRLQDELFRSSVPLHSSGGSCILRPQTLRSPWARLCDAYFDHGVYDAFNCLSSITSDDSSLLKALAGLARLLLWLFHAVKTVYAFLLGLLIPQLQLSREGICCKYSEVTDWSSGFVRALAWHPGTKRLAIALRNDSVILFSKNSRDRCELKHPKQVNVTCVAFRPFSGSYVAVGCERGLLIWNICATLSVRMPTTRSATLRLPGTLVTSIAWHPLGNLLAVCSARLGDVFVLTVGDDEVVPLTTFSILPAAHLLRWSRDGFRIFAASPSGGFNIWEGSTCWDTRRYASGVVTAACWSYSGCNLLYSVQGEPRIYLLNFRTVGKGTEMSLKPRVLANLDGHPDGICGDVSLMEWDRYSYRLAVAFKPASTLIAIFKTKLKPTPDAQPIGFLRGPAPPESMKFCPATTEGAILTACWSGGIVQHIPMHFDISAADRTVVLKPSAVSEIGGDKDLYSQRNLPDNGFFF